MLEESVTRVGTVLECFLNGSYYVRRNLEMPVSIVKNFLHLFKSATEEKRLIILANLHTKLDGIPRYFHELTDDEMPF